MKKNNRDKKILIIDFGSQYTQLIARRVRELGVFSIVISIDDFLNYKEIDEIFGIILSGGPNSVYKSKDHLVVKSLLNLNLPVLGICYGMHILIKTLGGKVEKANYREYGKADIKLNKNSILFKNINSKNSSINVWMSHGDSVTKLPKDVNVIASNKSTPVIAFSLKKNIFGLQFHPEVTHTDQGKKMIHNYLYEVCETKKLWTIRKIEKNETALDAIIREVKEETNLTISNPVFLGNITHKYSHFGVNISLFKSFPKSIKTLNSYREHRWIKLKDILNFPLPKANHKMLDILKKLN